MYNIAMSVPNFNSNLVVWIHIKFIIIMWILKFAILLNLYQYVKCYFCWKIVSVLWNFILITLYAPGWYSITADSVVCVWRCVIVYHYYIVYPSIVSFRFYRNDVICNYYISVLYYHRLCIPCVTPTRNNITV